MSSSAASAAWTLLMMASSAAALLGLLEQSLGFVEEPRVLQGDAHAAGERDQELEIGVGEGVFGVDVLNGDDTARFVADHQRHPDARLGHLAAADDERSQLAGTREQILVDHQRLAGAHRMGTETLSPNGTGSSNCRSPFSQM